MSNQIKEKVKVLFVEVTWSYGDAFVDNSKIFEVDPDNVVQDCFTQFYNLPECSTYFDSPEELQEQMDDLISNSKKQLNGYSVGLEDYLAIIQYI